jgi:hypothetical protein
MENHPYQNHYVAPHNQLNNYHYGSYWTLVERLHIGN